MPEHDPDQYGRTAAGCYDTLYGDIPDTEAAVGCLSKLAGTGPVLEFGVGTGRLALPLADRGLAVHGVEHSVAMIEELRRKDGARQVRVTRGDFATARVAESFTLVFVVFNTIFALPTHEDQATCLRNAFRHLRAGGVFVVEAMVFDPNASGLRGVRPRRLGEQRVELEAFRYDAQTQRLETTLIHLSTEGVQLIPANHCYAGPADIDVMAQAAGFELDARWRDWEEGAFTDTSERHISVYRRTA
jgi:SAM-dependent methyltransferase